MKKIQAIPTPPIEMKIRFPARFEPSHELNDFVRSNFLNPSSKLFNKDHSHLKNADIGYLFTNMAYGKKGRRIIGTAEQVKITGKWSDGRKQLQIKEFFGDIPEFIITRDARWYLDADNPSRCALIEHELYHCAQKKDKFNVPMFNKSTGQPLFTMK